TPPSLLVALAPDRPAALDIVERSVRCGGGWLDAIDGRALLAADEIPGVRSIDCATAAYGAAAAARLGVPVALKISSPDITHKTDIGGVVLDLGDSALVLAWAGGVVRGGLGGGG